jgi:DNA-binding transcriptional LysR family regulator
VDWEKLKIFHLVAKAGSFTGAAREMGVSQSALSRHVRDLEQDLGTALFTRHARGLVLTSEGEHLFEAASDVSKRLGMTEQALLETVQRPQGPLRVTTTVSFGAFWLTPRIKEFAAAYPNIRLELLLSDDDLDLSTRQADVAIRMHAPDQAELIQRPLVPVYYHIYGSAEYIELNGEPKRAEDLDDHDLIVYGPAAPTPIRGINWLLTVGHTGRDRKPILAINNLYGILEAVKSSLGLAALPDYLAAGRSDLVRVLDKLEGPSFKAHFVYPSELRRSKRVNAFKDFLIRKVAEDPAIH